MANESIVKKRLSIFLKKIGSNNNQFVVKMGYTQGFLNSKGGISESKLMEISKTYSQLNMNWLLTGDGEMTKNIPESDAQNDIQLPEVPEANKSETETIKSLLSVISDQANILKQVTSNKEQKHIEEQKEMFNKIEFLQKSLDNQGKYLQTLCKKIDDLISENNIPGQKKVG